MGKPSVTVQLDARAYNQMLRDLSFILGRSVTYRDLIRSETRAVLQTAASRTKAASRATMRKKYRVPKGREKVAGWMARLNGSPISLHWHFKPSRWAKIMAISKRAKLINAVGIEEASRRMIATAGLAKQSWLHLAVALGLFIKVPAYAYEARTLRGGLPFGNTRATQRFDNSAIGYIEVRNSSPPANSKGSGGQRAINSAIRGRITFFNRNMREGAFKTAAGVARAYPGITVR